MTQIQCPCWNCSDFKLTETEKCYDTCEAFQREMKLVKSKEENNEV